MSTDVFDELDRQHDELRAHLADLVPEEWSEPSGCEGWSVGDVVLHLAQTDELVLAGASEDQDSSAAFTRAAAAGAATVDDAAAQAVELDRGATPAELLGRWTAASAESRRILRQRPSDQPIRWVINHLPPRTLATTRLAEAWTHFGDIRPGAAGPWPADSRLWHIARLAWRTLPYAFSRAGQEPPASIALSLTAPDGDVWSFEPETPAKTEIRGPAIDWCLLAARRRAPSETALTGIGPAVSSVLELARNYA